MPAARPPRPLSRGARARPQPRRHRSPRPDRAWIRRDPGAAPRRRPDRPRPATLTRPGQPSATHPDRRIPRAHPFPPASPPSASSGGQAPARPRSARAPGSARPLVHPPDDNPKIANARVNAALDRAGAAHDHRRMMFLSLPRSVEIRQADRGDDPARTNSRCGTSEPEATPKRKMRNEPSDRRARGPPPRARANPSSATKLHERILLRARTNPPPRPTGDCETNPTGRGRCAPAACTSEPERRPENARTNSRIQASSGT